MVNRTTARSNLDAVFGALADPTRRAILARLAQSDASVAEIAAPFALSQPAISKHLKVLEGAGLIDRGVDRQRRPARLNGAPLADAAQWLSEFQAFWHGSLAGLDDLLAELQHKPATTHPRKPKRPRKRNLR